MTASRPVEITGMWSPEEHQELDWGSAILKSKISDGYPGGHVLLDIFVCTSMAWLNPHVIEYVSEGESLSYEYIRMVGSKKKNGKITFEDVHSGEKAQVDKKILLKLMTDLEKDFQETRPGKHSSKSKDVTTEEKSEGQTSYRKREGRLSPKNDQKPESPPDRKRGISQSPRKEQKPESQSCVTMNLYDCRTPVMLAFVLGSVLLSILLDWLRTIW